jgi:hypothetical protein
VDEYKDRQDVQFISFNLDANPGLVEPFAKEHALTFVVIPAFNYVTEKFNVYVPVPSNWVVDADGVVRLKGQGYDITGKWETGMKDAIAKVQGAATHVGPSK